MKLGDRIGKIVCTEYSFQYEKPASTICEMWEFHKLRYS